MRAARRDRGSRILWLCGHAENVLVCIEMHKRYDPMYADARNRIRGLGDFGYFCAYAGQTRL
jgi:D-galacturonate reductase